MGEDSSDTSDDEYEKLRAAVDPDFKIFDQGLTTNNSNGSKIFPGTTVEVKSKRKTQSIEFEAGHFVHPLRLTPECQKFVAKQLAESIDKNIKISKKKKIIVQQQEEGEKDGIFLFSSSTQRISGKDLITNQKKRKKLKADEVKQKPPVIKRRKIDDSSSEDEDSKLRSVAVSSDWVLNPMNV